MSDIVIFFLQKATCKKSVITYTGELSQHCMTVCNNEFIICNVKTATVFLILIKAMDVRAEKIIYNHNKGCEYFTFIEYSSKRNHFKND